MVASGHSIVAFVRSLETVVIMISDRYANRKIVATVTGGSQSLEGTQNELKKHYRYLFRHIESERSSATPLDTFHSRRTLYDRLLMTTLKMTRVEAIRQL